MRCWMITFGLLLSPALAAAEPFVSTYTKHDYERCPAQKSEDAEAVSIRVCPGANGHTVWWTSDPDASSVWIDGAGDEALDIGTAFEAGQTIEWRGPPSRPVAAIVRYAVGESVGSHPNSTLVIYRIEDKRSCIMGAIDARSPEANARARAIVDQAAQAFVCGTSKRVEK